MLDTVGFGAGAELVDGAGAGAELGGASVGDADELRDPLGELEEPEELDGLAEREPLPDGLADWPARTVGRAPAAPARRFLPWWPAAWLGVPDEAGDEADADGSVLVAAAAVWAGAVRANRVAKPTAVTALSCVARQVRRDRRRSPAERVVPGASPAGPAGNSYRSGRVGGSYRFCMDRDRSRAQVKGL